MRVLVACEESQEVAKQLRRLGHEAFSCDTQECTGGHPEWHIQGDVRQYLQGWEGTPWDMLIGFPPCTHLAVSGARHFPQKQADGRQEDALDFFNRLWHAPIPKIALENSVGIISTRLVKPTQYIQPYEYGDEKQKKTCLWLKGLPNLEPTNVVGRGEMVTYGSGKTMPKWYADTGKLTPRTRSRERSKTSPGVAKAMAEQWAGDCRGGGGGGGGNGDAMDTASAGMCVRVCVCMCVCMCHVHS
jgi:site-specific DNA-cytosine methylase